MPGRVGKDGILRRHGAAVTRLLHVGGHPVVLRVGQARDGAVHFGAAGGGTEEREIAIDRMRRALGVDLDLRPFYDEFRSDPLIGASVRRQPWRRPIGRPEPFEALAWAITEQLIDYDRAAAIQRRIVWAHGRHCRLTGLRDLPDAATLAGVAPARLQSYDLSGPRAVALRHAARVVANGLDLERHHEGGWARLRRIPGIGSWTVETLALFGQGRLDQIPAGDLGLFKLVGRLRSGGDPRARATEDEVRQIFAPYGDWKGLAALHAM